MACRYSLYTLLCIDEWEKSRVIGLLISSSQRAVDLAPHFAAFAALYSKRMAPGNDWSPACVLADCEDALRNAVMCVP